MQKPMKEFRAAISLFSSRDWKGEYQKLIHYSVTLMIFEESVRTEQDYAVWMRRKQFCPCASSLEEQTTQIQRSTKSSVALLELR